MNSSRRKELRPFQCLTKSVKNGLEKNTIPQQKMKIFGAKQIVNEFEESDNEYQEEEADKVIEGLKLCLHND